MSIAIFSNAVMRGFSDSLGRRTSLLPGLIVEGMGPDSPCLLVPAGGGWGSGEGIVTWDSFDSASRALSSCGARMLVIDYDAGSGTPADRLGFLRTASSLGDLWGRSPDARVVLVSGDLGAGEDGGLANLPNLSRRQVLGRIAQRADACFSFSPRGARQLAKRLGRPFVVLPAGSAVGKAVASPSSSRHSLGYEGDDVCLIGVLGRPGELDEERVAAGVREVTRVFPDSRVLRLFPHAGRGGEGESSGERRIGGTASSGWGSMRLRALDVVIHPVQGGSEGDDGVIQACLQHGLPIVGTLPPEGSVSGFERRPDGFGLVSDRDVGGFLEWIEQFQGTLRGGTAAVWRRELEDYYAEQCSATRALALMVGAA